jgi:hypothetical protein
MSVKLAGNTTATDVEVDTTAKAMRVTLYDVNGSPTQTEEQTFSASGTFTPAATPTDLVIIEGSATKNVEVLSMKIFTTNTAAGSQQFSLVKRSAADTTGTFAAATAVPWDSNDTPTANRVGHFTANPGALGATVGTVHTCRVGTPAAIPATWAAMGPQNGEGVEMIPGSGVTVDSHRRKTITLRGAAQCLAINFAGAALVAGQTHAYTVVWAED